MTTIVDCPTCTRKLNVPEDLLGHPVRCPDCGGTFEAGGSSSPGDPPAATDPAPSAPPLNGAPAEEAVPPRRPGTPYSVTGAAPAAPAPAAGAVTGLRACPFCGKEIAEFAVQCRFCGEHLADEDERPWEQPYRRRGVRRDCEPHRGVLVLVFGILSLVVPYVGVVLGVVAWVMGHKDLKKMAAGSMDPEGRGLTLAGKVCGIVGTLLQGLMLLFVLAEMVVIFGIYLPMSIRATATMKAPPPAVKAPPAPVAPPVGPPPVAPPVQAPPAERP
jgi:hypothetical protein